LADFSVDLAPWWLGAAGFRRDGDPGDFYAQLERVFTRTGSSDRWLPGTWDSKRLSLEWAYAAERLIPSTVCMLIARSLVDGRLYQADLENFSVTALVRAGGEETYLAIGAAIIADARIFGVIISAVPGVAGGSWQPEPGGVMGSTPGPGEVVWSTVLPASVAVQVVVPPPQCLGVSGLLPGVSPGPPYVHDWPPHSC
jgi:hypothetical protein